MKFNYLCISFFYIKFYINVLIQRSYSILIFPTDLTKSTADTSNFYACYVPPAKGILQFNINNRKLNNGSRILIYADSFPFEYKTNCGLCYHSVRSKKDINLEPTNELTEEISGNVNETCKACSSPTNVSVNFLELYMQVPLQCQSDDNCKDKPDFNITISAIPLDGKVEDMCPEGTFAVSQITQDKCIISNETESDKTIHPTCLRPTCSSEILSLNTSNEKHEHIVLPTTMSSICIWSLNTENRKYIQLTFSSEIKFHLRIFEDSLLNPKWDVEWCPDYGNEVVFKTKAKKVFIVYNNPTVVAKKGSITFMTHVDFCSLPPLIEHGKVEFKRLESGTIAVYNCNENYALSGPSQTVCLDKVWEEPPVCRPDLQVCIFLDFFLKT